MVMVGANERTTALGKGLNCVGGGVGVIGGGGTGDGEGQTVSVVVIWICHQLSNDTWIEQEEIRNMHRANTKSPIATLANNDHRPQDYERRRQNARGLTRIFDIANKARMKE